LTDLRAIVPDGKRFCPGKFVPVSKIEGNLPRLGAKSIHFVGYLPMEADVKEQREFLDQLADMLRPWWKPLESIEQLVTALTPGGTDAFIKE
jgi:hypothetical protein